MLTNRSPLLAPGALFLAVAAFAVAGCERKATVTQSVPEVLVTEVQQEDVPIYDDFVGTLDGSVNASIQARVQGYLTSQNYKEGGEVKKGDLLFQIDPRPFEAALAQAKAALAQAEAAARQAEVTAQRNVDLFARQGDQRTGARQCRATGRRPLGPMLTAQRAAVDQAQLNVDYTAIRSPIDGIAGLVKAQVGDLVGPTTGVLTTVSTVDPIKAFFTVSDQRYVAYTQRWAGNPEARAEHERQLEFELILANGSRFPHKGRLFAVDTEVDVRTGSQRIVAEFPNPGNILRRGQFVRVRMRSEVRQGRLARARNAPSPNSRHRIKWSSSAQTTKRRFGRSKIGPPRRAADGSSKRV